MSKDAKKTWATLGRETVFESPVFSIRRDRKRRSDERSSHDFYIIESVDWVNVVPITENDEIVFIEIHRHGTDELSLEIPGGMIDPEDRSPMAAGLREMEEETGYHSDELVEIGVVHPNPALQSNRCYSYLARNARLAGPPRLDETEDIRVVLHRRCDVPALVREGKISHALVVTCLYWLFAWEDAR